MCGTSSPAAGGVLAWVGSWRANRARNSVTPTERRFHDFLLLSFSRQLLLQHSVKHVELLSGKRWLNSTAPGGRLIGLGRAVRRQELQHHGKGKGEQHV